MNLTTKEIRKLILVFLGWRTVLFIIGVLASYFLKYDPSFPYADTILISSKLPQWLYSWANFDGVHYLTIIDKGYVGTASIQAFFPLFPMIAKFASILISNTLLAGLITANVFTLAFILIFYSFLKEIFNSKIAWTALLITLVFPTSLFLGSFYSESLFLTLVILSFYSAHKKIWWLAGISCALATAARVVGIALIPALFIELYLQTLKKESLDLNFNQLKQTLTKILISKKKELAWILFGSAGLLTYMAYLFQAFSDPLYFFHVQAEFGGTRSESLVLYPQVWWRSLKILLTYRPFDFRYFTYAQEFAVGMLGLLGLLVSYKKIRTSYLVFALGAFLLPTFTGTFSSMPRYLLACFPIFIYIALLLEKRRWWLALYLLGSSLLLFINTALFIQGYWVA